MALDPNEVLVSGNAYIAPPPVIARLVATKKIASGTGVLAELTPLWWDSSADSSTGAYKPWIRTKTIDAFLFQEAAGNKGLTLISGSTQLANVLFAGDLRRVDLPAAILLDPDVGAAETFVAGATEADLDAALIGSGLRAKDLYIQGLANFH